MPERESISSVAFAMALSLRVNVAPENVGASGFLC